MKQTDVELFHSAFINSGFTEIDYKPGSDGNSRISGKKVIDSPSGKIILRTYFYQRREFFTDTGELQMSVPALTLYISGPGLRPLGLQNVQLKYIKNPKKEDVIMLDDFAQAFLIMLEG